MGTTPEFLKQATYHKRFALQVSYTNIKWLPGSIRQPLRFSFCQVAFVVRVVSLSAPQLLHKQSLFAAYGLLLANAQQAAVA